MKYTNLVDLLVQKSMELDEKIAFKYLTSGDVDGLITELTYIELLNNVKKIASNLMQLDIKDKCVLVIYPSGMDFIEAFFSVIFAGAIPIPIQTVGLGNNKVFSSLFSKIVADSKVSFVLSPESMHEKIKNITKTDLDFIDASKMKNTSKDNWTSPIVKESDIAYIQYTSGSTNYPKGVCITHENILSNCTSIEKAEFHGNGNHVSWLPHYHDMGLVGSIICPIFIGTTTILMSPQSFLRKPIRWLKAIECFDATSSGGPTFAYDLILKTVSDEECKCLDLSSWSVAYCGAEPIRKETLEQFSEKFLVSGFNEINFLPCYGMAEATLFITGTYGLNTIKVNRDELSTGDIIIDDSSSTSLDFVSLGNVFDNTNLFIVDYKTKEILKEDKVGEIYLKGPSISSGYYNKALTDNSFNNFLGDEKGFFSTGDLGFLHEDELYICGRLKDMIIINGTNIYAQDIEYIASETSNSFDLNNIVAFKSNLKGNETFVVILGLRNQKTNGSDMHRLLEKVRSEIVSYYQVLPDIICTINAREIPKTSSGKIRRFECKKMWENNQFNIIQSKGKL